MKRSFLLFLLCIPINVYCQKNIPVTDSFQIIGIKSDTTTFTLNELLKLDQENLGDLLITNHKGEPKSVLKNLKGVSLKALLNNTAIHATWSKDFAQAVIILTASDGYSNSYSWNDLFNSDIGDHVYIITGEGNIPLIELSNRVAVISMKDYQTGIQ